MRRLLTLLIVHVLDPMILWCYGWRKVRLDPRITTTGPHYVDPMDPSKLYLKDQAVRICNDRARYPSDRNGGRHGR
jgi:hypothetical protein